MSITELLTLERTLFQTHVHSKKRLFEYASELIANDIPDFRSDEIFHTLLTRERLGSTAVGHGVAIPHGRLKAAKSAVGALLKLDTPLAFDAIDGEPVDLFFILLVPEEATDTHLEWLSLLAESFSDPNVRQALRATQTKEALFQTFTTKVDAILASRGG